MTDPNTPEIQESPGSVPPEKAERRIEWCAGHWAQMCKALSDRGLDDQISKSQEELDEKFSMGQIDPLWEACQLVNVSAIEIFGIEKILNENGGCPLCAFANMAEHIADVIVTKYGVAH